MAALRCATVLRTLHTLARTATAPAPPEYNQSKEFQMIALVSNRPQGEERSRSRDGSRPNWFTRVWARIIDWLVAPIDFPGKWPAREPVAACYNSSDEAAFAESNLPAAAPSLSDQE